MKMHQENKGHYTLINDKDGESYHFPKSIEVPVAIQMIGKAPVRLGMGDILERELKRLNITQESYIKLKARFGAMPTCNCEKRKQWLNKVGRYLGI
jgi:hypothetical protein